MLRKLRICTISRRAADAAAREVAMTAFFSVSESVSPPAVQIASSCLSRGSSALRWLRALLRRLGSWPCR